MPRPDRGWCLLMLGGDLSVGPIGYGAMQLTGPKVWGDYPDHDGGVGLLRAVVAVGVTFIDTADVYGPHSNEELIREALHPYPDDLVIATKGGFVRGGPEYSDLGAVGARLYLRQAAYTSMRRLGLDHIDLYYLHGPTMTDVPFEEAVATLAEMREAGLIRHIGVSNVNVDQLRTAMAITNIAAVTVHYNVGVRLGARVRELAQDRGIVFSPWHPGAVPGGDEGEPFHAVIDPIAARHGASPQQIALAWQEVLGRAGCPADPTGADHRDPHRPHVPARAHARHRRAGDICAYSLRGSPGRGLRRATYHEAGVRPGVLSSLNSAASSSMRELMSSLPKTLCR